MPKFLHQPEFAVAFLMACLVFSSYNPVAAFAAVPTQARNVEAHIHAELAPRNSPLVVAEPWHKPVATGSIERVFVQPNSDWGAGHRGVDMKLTPGRILKSPTSTTVTFAGQAFGRPLVTLQAVDGLKLEFEPACLLKSLAVRSELAKGQRFATFCPDETSMHCQDCLHWGVSVNGYYLSPQRFIGELKPSRVKPSGVPFDNQT